MDEAVVKQQDLLAEFEKIADELNKVLAQLEGSTLVKRLKAASRAQYGIAGKINDQLDRRSASPPASVGPKPVKVIAEMAEQEAKGSHDVSLIMDDMESYFERRRFMQFKTVLDEMRTQDVVGSLRQLGDDLKKETASRSPSANSGRTRSTAGPTIWSIRPQRRVPRSKSKAACPPSIVLEVLQILEGEVNLREETRVAEQAKPALAADEFGKQAAKLSETQKGLQTRVEKVTEQIIALPDSETRVRLRDRAPAARSPEVMGEATDILAKPDTARLRSRPRPRQSSSLLKSKRINPKGGGGGGSTPGGGGGGKTNDSALALLGRGLNEKEVREDRGVSQATGESGPVLPEEYRSGLDEYFNKLERGTKPKPGSGGQ